ncbi:hypothetical protein GobsT_37470 [Gemmata obscuriglobus]|uniref:Uncharacterized protein n=1 Tax=Gemmata obscuriglobus TaxID=114 RepID=A0A2Z3GWP0_9BACT|nr:hypothetical protein [Gemmata obscuriglobus]AWM38153.1 hypothetical protein C1280_14910 [Gemmata obscuriglobus]QEG28958.1 hypothetical protein GobsT_37470 [Gemmata obscuriglobus]VTS07491.1 Uncharacterized protein OS=Chthoniobacter flavus Ellin428 GN=CfE428DRAFT_3976 PE=4 SV=1 [Gemmata obscuriglobus UQM 2246]
MDNWPDAKIRSTALWYIGKHAISTPEYRYTLVGDAHPEALARAALQPGELVIVSFFLAADGWFLLTTRRVLGAYAGREVAAATLDVRDTWFGDFKTGGRVGLGVMWLRLAGSDEAVLQYETWRASMAPIYYFRYWAIKYPVLDQLAAEPRAAADGGGV